MNEGNPNMDSDKKLQKWLNKLQRESWQLELVISGFSIFLMIGAFNAIKEIRPALRLMNQGFGSEGELLNLGYSILVGACLFILINLTLHVLLRGIWISTIGLRYVSGDIDFDSLRLSPKFDRLLRRKIGSFDQYILRIENICSVVFSFTFLIVFMLIALGMYCLLFVSTIVLIDEVIFADIEGDYEDFFIVPIVVFYLLGGLIYFIDFVSLGYLKKVKWLSYIYIPVYRFFSLITLSFLYRPIYYNLIDNKFGRKVGFLLVPYVLLILLVLSGVSHSHTWYPDKPGQTAMLNADYDDQRVKRRIIRSGSIPTKFVENGFLEMFIAYLPKSDDRVLKVLCPDFEPFHESGLDTDLDISFNGNKKRDRTAAADTALVCFSQLYEIYVDDSLYQEPTFKFHRHINHLEYGLHAVIDVDNLPRGPHDLKVNKLSKRKVEGRDTLMPKSFFIIPFWKE